MPTRWRGCSTCLAAVVGGNVDVGCPQAWCSVYCSNIEAGGDVYSEDERQMLHQESPVLRLTPMEQIPSDRPQVQIIGATTGTNVLRMQSARQQRLRRHHVQVQLLLKMLSQITPLCKASQPLMDPPPHPQVRPQIRIRVRQPWGVGPRHKSALWASLCW